MTKTSSGFFKSKLVWGRDNSGWLALSVVLLALTASFIYGWYFDTSAPHAGSTWIDQRTYTAAAARLANGHLPTLWGLHFGVGYPILGAIGHLLLPNDPFMLVSFGLLISSATLCFLAARYLFGAVWATLFCALLFYWDGAARSFQYASDLFAVPWNNQVLFLTMAFFLWLFVTRSSKSPTYKLVVAIALVSGLSFLTREESMLFIVPILAAYFLITKTSWRKWVLCYAIVGFCFLPQLFIKAHVLGSATSSGRTGEGYNTVLSKQYFKLSHLTNNLWGSVVDSHHFKGSEPDRPALLQAAPWLWVSPMGIVLAMFLKRYPLGLKIFMVVNLVLIAFYLSGANMSVQKLRFHSLRYIAPGFIGLNLAVIVALREGLMGATRFTRKLILKSNT